MKKSFSLCIAMFFAIVFDTHAQGIITTIAGIGVQAFSGDSGLAVNAGLFAPYDIALDGSGNYYIADGYNNRIRKVNSAGIITTIAGRDTAGYNGDNILAINAQLYRPAGITCDHAGNIYFADAFNNRVRKINTATGIITTIAGNGSSIYNGDDIAADSAGVYNPHRVAIDTAGNIFITDWGNHRIRKVNTAGVITTIAGTGIAGDNGDNGPADTAEIDEPYGIAVDNSGNIYFADLAKNKIRAINAGGTIITIAGTGAYGFAGDGGAVDTAEFKNPSGIAVDAIGNIYIADGLNQRIRKVTVSTGVITTIAGNGIHGYTGDHGLAINAEMADPVGITLDAAGNIYVVDFGNNCIRYITAPDAVSSITQVREKCSVYPNPCKGVITLFISSTDNEQAEIRITNISGEEIKKITVHTNEQVRIGQLPEGVYILSVATKNSSWVEKIVVER